VWKGKKMSGTAKKACDCKNEFQDKRYGKGKLVHNVDSVRDKPGYKCTVCGKKK